jgi:tRNA (guanine37-N1)-methyltransferase
VLICGHYEGVDERVSHLLTREVSLGDFVLTCGEIPALTLINGVVRLLPGTVGKPDSLKYESFEARCWIIPSTPDRRSFVAGMCQKCCGRAIMQAIAQWRLQQQIERTRQRRPDLYAMATTFIA